MNKTFLVTAGPTFEKIDPVRFIGNYSSGKMGYAIAEKLTEFGAKVILISGPVEINTEKKEIRVVKVESTEEMYNACIENFEKCDGGVMSAAVSDFTPVNPKTSKNKRGKENWLIELKPTRDIASELGRIKRDDQLMVGFALETNDEIVNAKKKLAKKKFDLIVLNSLNDKGAGFGTDTNKVTLIDKYNNIESFELKSKSEVAKDIVEKMVLLMNR